MDKRIRTKIKRENDEQEIVLSQLSSDKRLGCLSGCMILVLVILLMFVVGIGVCMVNLEHWH